VRLCGDGALVLCHDARLDRTTDGSGLIAALPLAAIRQFDAGALFDPAFAGERVPTLDEALDLAAELGLGVNIEIKADHRLEEATAAACAAVLSRRQADADMMLVSSFLPTALAALQALVPQIRSGLLFRSIPSGWAKLAQPLACGVIGADQRRLRPDRVAAVRAAGYQLAAFTVNDPARAGLLFDWGVTSVFSDVPDIMRGVGTGHRGSPARQGAIR